MKTEIFEFNGYQATVLIPEQPNGKWIWKTEFFYAFDQAEQALFERGYTRVYYQISNKYGSEDAVRLMAEFHSALTRKYTFLSPKSILFGFSRGGLYAFNFALKYPHRVSKIYLDAPVMNLKSWPHKDTKEQAQFFAEYGIDADQLGAFTGSPIDKIEEFSKNGIPILLIVGAKDLSVPFEENSKKLLDFYRKSGLDITFYNKEEGGHHPHSLEDVTPILDFIEREETPIVLSQAHLEKRAQKKGFVLRLDVLGSYLQRAMSVEDYFVFTSQFPDEADKLILDCMYSGDWYSALYNSEFLPHRKGGLFDRFVDAGVEALGEWVKIIQAKKKECWLSYRISEVLIGEDENPSYALHEHPEWYIPAFGKQMLNLSVPEVREQKLKVIAEVMRKFPIDGLDIDFERHTPILPVGNQWQMREHITEFMRMVRKELLEISKEQNRVVMLSARIPDCLKGCKEDGLDVWTWIQEGLVDCLTLGSRSFDVKVEEFRSLTSDLQIYACYDPHHTVDGYTFPPIETIYGVCYTHLQRGADAVEYFNWTGEGKKELVAYYVDKYKMDKSINGFMDYSNDDFTGINDKDFLERQDKTYVIDRKGGYPWGVGYGNLNGDRQLPATIEKEGEVYLYVAEDAAKARTAMLKLLFEELAEMPEIYFNDKKLSCTACSHRDLQVTTETEAPMSGYTITRRLLQGVDMSKPCTMLTCDLTGIETKIGYNDIRVVCRETVRLEKVELTVKR